MTWWGFLLVAAPAFALGWLAHGWQCSQRVDCPLYTLYTLKKWKRRVEVQIAQGRRNRTRSHPTPPEGRAA